MKRISIRKSFLLAGLAGGIAVSASGQVIFSDNFNYATNADLVENWNVTGSPTITTNLAGFSGGTAVSIARTTTSDILVYNQAWSYTPTDENPLQFTVRMFDAGSGTTLNINSAGIRTGANPLFEMGFNNQNYNVYGVRLVSFHGSPSANWAYFGPSDATAGSNIREEGWHTFQATIGATSTVVTLDLQSDGEIDYTMTFSGVAPGAFTDLRFGGPAGAAAQSTNPILYDMIDLQIIPEPSTYAAIFGALALVGAAVYRRRLNAKS